MKTEGGKNEMKTTYLRPRSESPYNWSSELNSEDKRIEKTLWNTLSIDQYDYETWAPLREKNADDFKS